MPESGRKVLASYLVDGGKPHDWIEPMVDALSVAKEFNMPAEDAAYLMDYSTYAKHKKICTAADSPHFPGWESNNIPNKHYDIKQVFNTECVQALTKISLNDDGTPEIVCIYEEGILKTNKRPRNIDYDDLCDLMNKHPCCSDALKLIQTHFESV